VSVFYMDNFKFINEKEFDNQVDRCATEIELNGHIHEVFELENQKIVVTRIGEGEFSVDPWDGEYWSGCNRWINQGKHEQEPIGTATSMHECGDCVKLSYCKLKKETSNWKWNEEIEEQMETDWKSMMN
jgi:hypothetical protein